MVKKFLSILLLLLLIVANATTCYGDEVKKNTDLFRIYLDDKVNYLSETNSSNMKKLNDNLTQVVFRYAIKDETWTFGIAWDNAKWKYNPKYFDAKLTEYLDSLEKDIIKAPITKEDLLVCYYEADSKSSDLESVKHRFTKDLRKVKDIKELVPSKRTQIKKMSNTIKSSNYSINGSYHYFQAAGGFPFWYDQLNNQAQPCTASFVEPHSGDGNQRFESG